MYRQALIYTITTVHPQHPSHTRCWGWFQTPDDALSCVSSARPGVDDEAGFYSHLVIEELPQGIVPHAQKLWWFTWNGEQWAQCEQPEEMARVCNFAMG